MMKFCCDRFNAAYILPNYYGLNIRIVKYKSDELFDTRNLLRFYITTGYKEGDVNVPNFNIAFCPFCGKDLFDFYKSDNYANEKSGKF